MSENARTRVGTSGAKEREREAAQAALRAEHAAVYGYGVVGGRIAAARRD
ncbi:DUF4439 domain-containing protein, partial [Streptomyces sp. SID11385]|nr:DUF4439 domain-containing protein [Streptomyces sp. SID11385]